MCIDCIAPLPLPAFACSGETQFATGFEDGLLVSSLFLPSSRARRVPVLRNRVMGSRPEGKLERGAVIGMQTRVKLADSLFLQQHGSSRLFIEFGAGENMLCSLRSLNGNITDSVDELFSDTI